MSRPASRPSPKAFSTFGDLLKYLRRRAQLTQRDLSIAVGYSEPQISYLEKNHRLPDVATVAARFVPALFVDEAPELAQRLVELAEAARHEEDPAPGLPPFKGLQYFDEADATLFFGREALTAKLVNRLTSYSTAPASHFLAVVGASGSGKSSVVRAGLVPGLRKRPEYARWRIGIVTPTAHPLEVLAAHLPTDHSNWPLLLVVDQFEELFTLCAEETERKGFVDHLLVASRGETGPTTVVIALRADFYSECAHYPNLREALAQRQEYIGPMSAEELHRAIKEPAKRGGWEFEPGLVDLLLRDTGEEPGALPLLSHALLETWTRRRGRLMTVSGYLASGGVRGAIAETAETVFQDELDPSQRTIARSIFLRLTELGEGTQDTRRRAALAELIPLPEEAPQVEAVVEKLADARLITTAEGTAEVAHEALIREWPTLRQWLAEDREGLRLHRHLTQAAQEWEVGGRDPSELYRGARLAQLLERAASNPDELNVLERTFLEASQTLAAQEEAEREAQRRHELEAAHKLAETERRAAAQLRRRALYLTGAFILALVMAGTALFFGAQSRRSAETAQAARVQAERDRVIATSRELAAAAINNLTVDPERSILLALQAIDETYSTGEPLVLPEAEDALHRAVLASHVRLSWSAHRAPIWVIAYSPDGKRLASASQDGTARIWDAATGQELLTLQVVTTGGVGSVVFGPDGTRLATSSDDGKGHLWDAATGQRLLTLSGHTAPVWGIAFSPDGKRLATGSTDKTAIVWDSVNGQKLMVLTGHTDPIAKVAFSPEDGGARLATSGLEGTVKVWDSATGRELLSLQAGTPLAFSTAPLSSGAGATRLATGWWDGNSAKVWDAATGQELLSLFGHTNAIHNVAFSPDGKRLATVSRDRTARVWDSATGKELLTLYGNPGPIYGVAFSPDGIHLATGDEQGAVRIWDIGPDQELFSVTGLEIPPGGFSEPREPVFSPDGTRLYTIINLFATGVSPTSRVKVLHPATGREVLTLAETAGVAFDSLALSPDGTRLATGGSDGHVRLWDSSTGQSLLNLPVATGEVWGIAFSPDGKWLATPGKNNTAQVWDAATGQALLTLTGHADEVLGLAFSPDGRRLATASVDKTARVWDLSTGQALVTLTGHADNLWAVAYSPDGTRLATASRDGTGRIWDAATGQAFFTLKGHTNTITDLAFSPDGTRLATTSNDSTLKLWDVATGQELLNLPGVGGVAFSPDGEQLATVNRGDLTIRMYALRIEDLVALARSRLTRGLTIEECRKYLHVEPCPQP